MKLVYCLLFVFIVSTVTAQDVKAVAEPKKDNFNEKVSYMIGMDVGKSVKNIQYSLDLSILIEGLKSSFNNQPSKYTNEELQETHEKFKNIMSENMKQQMTVDGKKNIEEGNKFLAENKAKEGVKTTASGLQYTIIKEGTGMAPGGAQTVKVNYKGMLLNGEEFDSSYKRGQPATFSLSKVIPGFREGIALLKEGGVIKLFIPPELAYGDKGAGMMIKPNATLIFEIELLEIVKE